MAEKTYEEWLEAFRRRKALNTPEQKLADLVLGALFSEKRNRELVLLEYVPEELKEQVRITRDGIG
jgi:hypothetical protein